MFASDQRCQELVKFDAPLDAALNSIAHSLAKRQKIRSQNSEFSRQNMEPLRGLVLCFFLATDFTDKLCNRSLRFGYNMRDRINVPIFNVVVETPQ